MFQKHILLRFGLGVGLLFLSLVFAVSYGIPMLWLSSLLFAAFFLFLAVQLYGMAAEGAYLIIEGMCIDLESSPFRKRQTSLVLETEFGAVRIALQGQNRLLTPGCSVKVYISQSTPVYEQNQYKVICSYLFMEVFPRRIP